MPAWGTRLTRRSSFAASVVLALALVAGFISVSADTAEATSGSDFRPGSIISDATFYNSNAMTAAQIQGFIDAKEKCVAGYTCLESFRINSVSHAGDAKCAAFTGVANQLASDVIFSVAQACGINPQVFLVLMEKEQGLVSSNAPSAYKYNNATGYACPDTGNGCDPLYGGFANQLYFAARQYQTYRLSASSFNFVAGRTFNIGYNVAGAKDANGNNCAAPAVYIENQATAGLYNYTPYQPNAAALNNLYGTGDSCSAYGNRNFWRIFSDWFGNPLGGGSFAKTADNGTIYLLTADHKYPVPNQEVLGAYWGLGPFRVVSSSYLSGFTTGIALGQVVRDPTTGQIFYSDAGIKHYVSSCDQLTDYNVGCNQYIDLMPTQILGLQAGAPLSRFALSTATGAVYYVAGGIKRWVHSMDTIYALNAGQNPDLMKLGPTALSAITDGPDYVSVGNFIQVVGQSQVYLVDSDTTLIPLAAGSTGSDFTTTAVIQVGQQTISSRTVAGSTLSPVVTCGSATYIASAGQLWPVTGGAVYGLPVTALNGAACATLGKSAVATMGAVFVRQPSTGAVFFLTNGTKSHLTSMAAVNNLNGGTSPVLLPESDATLAAIANSRELLAPGTLVKAASSPVIYLVDGLSKLVPIDYFETASEFGVNGFTVISDQVLNGYSRGSAVLSPMVTCGASYLMAGGGQLWPITRATNFGLPTTALDPFTCAILARSPQSIAGNLFVRSPVTGAIYQIASGRKTHLMSMDAVYSANGGTAPLYVPLSQTVLNVIPG